MKVFGSGLVRPVRRGHQLCRLGNGVEDTSNPCRSCLSEYGLAVLLSIRRLPEFIGLPVCPTSTALSIVDLRSPVDARDACTGRLKDTYSHLVSIGQVAKSARQSGSSTKYHFSFIQRNSLAHPCHDIHFMSDYIPVPSDHPIAIKASLPPSLFKLPSFPSSALPRVKECQGIIQKFPSMCINNAPEMSVVVMPNVQIC